MLAERFPDGQLFDPPISVIAGTGEEGGGREADQLAAWADGDVLGADLSAVRPAEVVGDGLGTAHPGE